MTTCHKCGGVITDRIHFISPWLWLPREEFEQLVRDNAPLPMLCGSCFHTVAREMAPLDRERAGIAHVVIGDLLKEHRP